jgi:hypothetical protein
MRAFLKIALAAVALPGAAMLTPCPVEAGQVEYMTTGSFNGSGNTYQVFYRNNNQTPLTATFTFSGVGTGSSDPAVSIAPTVGATAKMGEIGVSNFGGHQGNSTTLDDVPFVLTIKQFTPQNQEGELSFEAELTGAIRFNPIGQRVLPEIVFDTTEVVFTGTDGTLYTYTLDLGAGGVLDLGNAAGTTGLFATVSVTPPDPATAVVPEPSTFAGAIVASVIGIGYTIRRRKRSMASQSG